MANIGRVFKDSYMKDGKKVPIITMDIRTISTRKKFTIAVNRLKWESGKVGEGLPTEGKIDHPDYHVWANFSNRGESIPSEIVGSIKDMVSEAGLKYKRGNIFDPFIQKEAIYFTLFQTDADKKIDENELYRVVAQPYRRVQTNNNDTNAAAQPNYEPQQNSEEGYVDVDEDEIPF
jgi:hypothetical protein